MPVSTHYDYIFSGGSLLAFIFHCCLEREHPRTNICTVCRSQWMVWVDGFLAIFFYCYWFSLATPPSNRLSLMMLDRILTTARIRGGRGIPPKKMCIVWMWNLQEYLQNLSRLAESPGFLLLFAENLWCLCSLSSSIFQQIFQNPCAYTTPHVFS